MSRVTALFGKQKTELNAKRKHKHKPNFVIVYDHDNIIKMVDKSKYHWKHGKHKGMQEIALIKNRSVRSKRNVRPIDTSKPNWSTK